MGYYFSGSQAEALQYCRTILQTLTINFVEFANFDAQRFVPFFLTGFAKAIEAVENIQDDETVVDQQSIKTQVVETTMVQARKQFQELKYFVQKAFPNQPNQWSKFGFDDYSEVRDNPVKMIPFLLKVYKLSDANRSALVAQGATDQRIDDFQTTYQSLVNAVTEQDMAKNERGVVTQMRITALDALFDEYLTPTREVAKFVYAENAAMYSQFLLPRRSSSSSTNSTTIAANTKTAVFSQVSATAKLSVKNTGNVALTIYLADSEAAPAHAQAKTVAAGSLQIFDASELSNGSGSVLVVWNEQNSEGSFIIQEVEE